MKHVPPTSARAAALRIVQTLRKAGHTALFAGGCVRDMLMRRQPADFDVATDARPDRIISLFRRTQKVGVQFGVVIVGIGRHWVEVATFRSDLDYADGRRPTAVRFSDARHDAERRDFTINGMFYEPISREVIDYVGGQSDLKAGIIRAIGDASKRFGEDHLRMLRAVRFAARLGFRIEAGTHAAIGRHAASISRVSPERIGDELERILTHSSRAAGWHELCAVGLLPHLWRGADSLIARHVEIGKRLGCYPSRAVSFELGLASVLLGRGAGAIRDACAALRTSNETRDAVGWLCRNEPRLHDDASVSMADLKFLMANGRFGELLLLLGASLKASGASPAPHRRLKRRASAVPPEAVAPPPFLTGEDLLALNVPQGPIYRVVLERVYRAQLDNDVVDRAMALATARQILAELGNARRPER